MNIQGTLSTHCLFLGIIKLLIPKLGNMQAAYNSDKRMFKEAIDTLEEEKTALRKETETLSYNVQVKEREKWNSQRKA